ncbi:MAG: hypothetical protein Q4A41_04815 [Bacillota bacterium]|nr:hypothetical protein [Bacillota bacterium]
MSLKKVAAYFVIGLLYYLLPRFFIQDTGSAMFIILLVIPLIVFLVSTFHAVLNGFTWYFSVIVGLLWTPIMFLLLNNSATVYVLIYAVVSYVGQLSGVVLSRKKI